jgi:phosphoglycolate phosphatase
MTIEAILFDKDGTLFDFQATWMAPVLLLLDRLAPAEARPKAAEALGIDLATQRFRPGSVVIANTSDQVARTLADALGLPVGKVLVELDRVGEDARQVPAVPLREVLGPLARDYRLGLVTNDTEAPARAHLDREGVLDLFDFVAGYDSGFGAKPGPGQLLAFAEKTGIAPANSLMVGDSRHDLVAGRAAGMIPIGVLTGIATEADLADLAHVVLPDIGHLEAWLGASRS